MNKLHIPPLDEQAAKAALEHQKILAKPPLALGKLEPVAIQIAAMTGNPAPRLKDKTVVLFASDHHIADHGLSLTSTDVTYIQTRNFLQGGGTINAFTRNAGARLTVVDVGVNVGKDGVMRGDAAFEEVEPIVEAITPVPGGVGSVTTSVLMKHVVEAAERA